MKKTFLTIIITLISYYSYAQPYLPLTAGTENALTGSLYSNTTGEGALIANNAGINRLYQILQGTSAYGLFGIEASTPTMFTNALSYATVLGSKNPTALQLGANGTIYQTITTSGNIGIGTTSPAAPLQIQTPGGIGSVQLGSWVTSPSAGAIYLNNNFTNGNGYNFLSTSTGSLYINRLGGTNILFREDNGTDQMVIASGGNIGIGTGTPDTKLTVNGTIHSKEVKVDMNILPDYVFKPTYNLASLQEVKAFIDQNHHLPEVPSAQQVAKDGLNLGEMNGILLKKVEELTLYLIDKDKQVVDLNRQVTKQDEKLIAQQQVYESLQEQINELVKKLKNK